MQIDWLTLAAQVVNFLILLVLLYRFGYRPIMRVMADREREIEERLHDADEAKQRAEERARQLEEERSELDRRRRELTEEAEEEAAERRRTLLDEARREVDERRQRWLEQLERERAELGDALERRLSRLVVDALDRALGSLASESLERRIVSAFLDRLDSLDDERRAALREAAAGDGEHVVVRTAFDLEDEHRQALESAVADLLDEGVEPRLEVSEEVMAGVELAVGDQRLGWSVHDYLESLDDVVHRRLQAAGRDSGDDVGDGRARAEESS